MHWLKAAIARLAGLLRRLGKATVSPIQAAGLASPERMTPTGNSSSAPGTLLQPQPAQAASRKKLRAVQPTTAASKSSSKRQSPAPTDESLSNRGSSTKTPAHQTRLPVSPVQSQPAVAAQYTLPEQSRTHEQALVQTHMDSQYGVLGKQEAPASKTRPPAKSARKAKRKPAKRTKAASKATSGKAPAQTRTAKPSGARGN